MSLSLNAGAELDEDEVVDVQVTPVPEVKPEDIFEPASIEPGSVPDLKGDVEVIYALESKIDDLLYLQADIEKAHGMNQQFAMECERLVPGFGKGAPIGFYTKDVTATRYKVSLEELSKTIWALIAAVAAAIVALIVKFVYRLTGKKDEDVKSVTEVLEQREKVLEKDTEVVSELADATRGLSNIDVVQSDGSTKRTNFDALVRDMLEAPRYEQLRDFLSNRNPYYHDIIQHGRWSKAVEKAIPFLAAINRAMRDRMELLEQVTELDKLAPHDIRQKVKSEAAIRALSHPIPVPLTQGVSNLTEAADYVGNLRQQTGATDTEQELPYELILSGLAAAHRRHGLRDMYRSLRETVSVFGDMKKRTEALQKSIGSMQFDGTPGHNSEGVASKLREVLRSITRDVDSYIRLIHELQEYMRYLHEMTDPAKTIAFEASSNMRQHVRSTGKDLDYYPSGVRSFILFTEEVRRDKSESGKRPFGRKLFS